MSTDLEIEFKNSLTKEEYISLLATYKLEKTELKTQTNYYFDTPNELLRKNKMGLRVRVLAKSIEFTLKTPTADSHSYIERTDYLKEFNPAASLTSQTNNKNSDVLTYLVKQHFPIDQLEPIGELTTVRAEKKITPDILLVLDKSMYYGMTDYELEMEVSDVKKGRIFFDCFLKEHNLKRIPTKKKLNRMFERKNSNFI